MSKEHLTDYQFKKGQSGNPVGRPKKIYTILKEKGYSGDDIKTAFKEIAFYTLDELNSAAHDKTKPIIVRIICQVFYKAYKTSDWNRIREIIEHIIGRPTQEFKGSEVVPLAVKLLAPEEENE